MFAICQIKNGLAIFQIKVSKIVYYSFVLYILEMNTVAWMYVGIKVNIEIISRHYADIACSQVYLNPINLHISMIKWIILLHSSLDSTRITSYFIESEYTFTVTAYHNPNIYVS